MTQQTDATPKPVRPAILRRRPLKSARDCARQASTVFWLARNGKIETIDAQRLCMMLWTIGRLLESGELAERIETIEEQLRDA